MTSQVQLRRQTTAVIATLTGPVGEVFYDTDKKSLCCQDGSTMGGFYTARETRSIGTGEGLTGGGDLSADRTLALDIDSLTAEATPTTGDKLVIWDGANHKKIDWDDLPGSGGGEANTASNQGAGVGVFDEKNGVDLEFRSLVAASTKLSISLDDPNDEIDLDVVEANIDHGSIGGLGDDDHTIYPLLDGTRPFDNTGLRIDDTGGDHYLQIAPSENLTANRILSIAVGDAARTLTLGGNTTLNGGTHSGTNTGDQTITLTGDVTGSGTGSFATTIAAGSVDNTMLVDMAAYTLQMRNAGTGGDPAAVKISALTEEASPTTGDWILGEDDAGNLRKYDVGNLPTGGGGEANTASNQGAGVGVFDEKSGVDLEFRSLVAASTKISISLDDPNDEIDLDVVPANISHLGLADLASGDPHTQYVTPGGDREFDNAGLRMKDTGNDHYLALSPSEDLSANRTLSLDVNDGDRTLTIDASTTLGGGSHSGTNTGDEPAATTTVAGVVELATDGESAANVAVQGNDSRLSDARTPTAHATSHESGGSDPIDALTFANTGLHILEASGVDDLIIASLGTLTADRTLSLDLGDANRTLTIGGDTTLNGGTHSGTNTGDQTITLTGDVTGTGTGSFATTIAAGTVDNTSLANAAKDTCWAFRFGNGTDVLSTGVHLDVPIPYDCTILSVEMHAKESGSCVVDIWADSYANLPPTDADSITASAPPTISTAIKSQDATLTGWTTSLTAGEWLRFNVDSATTITQVTLAIYVRRVD